MTDYIPDSTIRLREEEQGIAHFDLFVLVVFFLLLYVGGWLTSLKFGCAAGGIFACSVPYVWVYLCKCNEEKRLRKKWIPIIRKERGLPDLSGSLTLAGESGQLTIASSPGSLTFADEITETIRRH